MRVPADSGEIQLERRRDSQQWMLDLAIKLTGREQNFEGDGRRFPPEVKSHAMIPRVMFRRGRHREELARAADERSHGETAVRLYYAAVEDYRLAQHAIYRDDDADKRYICQRMYDCYDRIIALNPTPIERIDVAFEGRTLSGLLHLVPGGETRPLVVFCPGMDMTKEAFPEPGNNEYLDRGMHLLSIDGPGQGVSNLRKIRVDVDNYERGAGSFLDALVERPEIDAERIGVTGRSMGSYWAMRIAATDPRIRAVASSVANYGSKRHIFERSSPRFKQIFMYMAGYTDEDEFDELASRMTLFDLANSITCPTLMVNGEYDPLCPLEEALEVFDRVSGPKEMWVVEDMFHRVAANEHFGTLEADPYLADWLRDAFGGRAPREDGRKVFIQKTGAGPFGPSVPGFHLQARA